MFVEIHYGGVFRKVRRKKYVGGKVHIIKEFFTKEWSWFELTYHLKQVGVVSDFVVYHKLSDTNFDTGWVRFMCVSHTHIIRGPIPVLVFL